MQKIIDNVLQRISRMSDAEFAEKLIQHRADEVAVTLRHIQDECAGVSAPPCKAVYGPALLCRPTPGSPLIRRTL